MSGTPPLLGTGSDVRVLHVITGMSKGGAEKVVIQLATARDANASIAWLKGPCDWKGGLPNSRVGLHPLGVGRLHELPRALARLSATIRRVRPDVVHTHLTHAHIVGRWAARRAGLPTVSTEHNLRVLSGFGARMLNSLDVRSSRRAKAVIAISNAVRARCVELGFREDTLQIVYNGVDARDEAIWPGPRPRALVVMVGRLHRSKGADIFLRAMERMSEVDGLLVGDGPERAVIAQMVAALPEQVRLEWVRGGDAGAAISQADVFVAPSRSEGLGLAALEAMALGKPVVATRVGGLPEVVKHGVTGLLVEPESPEALAAAVRELLADADLRARMGDAGRARVLERFTLDQMLGRYEDIYRAASK